MLLPLSVQTLHLLMYLDFSLLPLAFCIRKNVFEVANLLFDCFVILIYFSRRPLALRQLTFLRLFDYCVFEHVVIGIDLGAKVCVNCFNVFYGLIEKFFATGHLIVRAVIASVAWNMKRWPVGLSTMLFETFVQLKERCFLFHVQLGKQRHFVTVIWILLHENQELNNKVDFFGLLFRLLSELFTIVGLLRFPGILDQLSVFIRPQNLY